MITKGSSSFAKRSVTGILIFVCLFTETFTAFADDISIQTPALETAVIDPAPVPTSQIDPSPTIPDLGENAIQLQEPVVTDNLTPTQSLTQQSPTITDAPILTESVPSLEIPTLEIPEIIPPDVQSLAAVDGQPPSAYYPEREPAKTNLAVNTDLSTGALTYDYPIFSPPGRNGLNPELSLSYNSYNADNESILGLGWNLNIPYIERIPRLGTMNMYSQSYFNSSLSGELTGIDFDADQQHGKYGAQTDYGDFLDYEFNANNQWIVKDKYGKTYTFGRDLSSRQVDPDDNSRIYRWSLSDITDSNNNKIYYTYFRDSGQLYPSIIYYNNDDVNQGARIVFNRENRADISATYHAGFEVKTRFRINRIEISYAASIKKTYDLGYTAGDNKYSSLLATITEGGVQSTLPADRFEYKNNNDSRGWQKDANYILPVDFHNWADQQADNGVRIFDVNGDGYDDIVQGKRRDIGGSIYNVYINRADGSGWGLNANYSLPEAFIDADGNDTGLRIGDVNGDGLADLLPNVGGAYINRGDGTGWSQNNAYSTPVRFINANNQDNGVRLADVNGDGLIDLIWSNSGHRAVYVNRGDEAGWDELFWDVPIRFDEHKSGTADLNGDGLADLYSYDPLIYTFEVYINKGKLVPGNFTIWQQDANYTLPQNPNIQPFVFDPEYLDFRIIDVNGDDLSDLIFLPCNDCWTNNGGWIGRQVFINKGNGEGWQRDNSYDNRLPTSFWNGFAEATETGDVNGDGMIDFLTTKEDETPDNPSGVFINRASKTNLIKDIYTRDGGQISVRYKPSAQYKNANGTLANPSLPLVMQTVYSIDTQDRVNGGHMVNSFGYEGGKYYFGTSLKRKFAGFGVVSRTDLANNLEKSYFHQGNGNAANETGDNSSKIGMMYWKEIFDNTGVAYENNINKWGSTNLNCENRINDPCERSFVYKERYVIDDLAHSQYSTPKASAYSYDSRGNLIEERTCGTFAGFLANNDVQCIFDRKVTQLTYANYGNGTISGLPSSETVRDGNAGKVKETKYYYDNLPLGQLAAGNNTRTEYWKGANDYINTQKSFNQSGLLTSSVDPNGGATTYAYDQDNLFPTVLTNALGQRTETTYDYFSGNTLRTTDPNGAILENSYDDFQRKTEGRQSSSDGLGPLVVKSRYAYFDNQSPRYIRQTESIDANTTRITYTYFDGLNRILQKRTSTEQANVFSTIDYTYNNKGLLSSTSLPYFSNGTANTARNANNSLYATTTYDPLGRVVSISKATGVISYTYANWRLRVTDENNNVKDYFQDNFDQLTQVTEYNQGVAFATSYQYNLNGDLLGLTDAAGNVQNFTYDSLGRMLSKADLHAANDNTYGTWSYTYDNAGNLVIKTDPKNQITTYTYDALSRPLVEDFSIAPGIEAKNTYDLCPNGIGRLCRIETPKVSTNYQYDKLGNTSKELKTIDLVDYLTQTTYNYQNAPSSLTYPDGTQVGYSYNAGGNIESVTKNGANLVTNIDYSPLGQVSRVVLANGVTTQNTYNQNALYRLTAKLTINAQHQNLQNLAYTYDAVGNITDVNDTSQTNASKLAHYEYDSLYRLTRATISNSGNGAGTNYIKTFTYDRIGNITNKSDLGAYLYQGNVGNNYTNPHAVTSIAGIAVSYDRNGNVTNDGRGLTLDWDYNDRLLSSTKNNVVTNYVYDFSGNRAMKVVGSAITIYPSDYFELDATGTTKHIYAGSELVATIESDNNTETLYYPHSDHLGGSSVITDSAGAMVQLLDYYPFGETRIDRNFAGSTVDESHKFTGQELDEDSGLYYYGARYYSPTIGRFLSQDPASGDLANPQTLNKYSYVLNNPLRYTDPTGMWPTIDDASKFFESATEVLNNIGDFLTFGQFSNSINEAKSAGDQIAEQGLNLNTASNAAVAIVEGTLKIGGSSLLEGFLLGKGKSSLFKMFKDAIEKFKGGGRLEGVPKNWIKKPTNGNDGVIYQDPENAHNSVRVMEAKPNSKWPSQQKPYVINRSNGKPLDINGNPVLRDSAEAHIPKDKFKFKP